jgi:hypothetical protein
VYLAVILDAFSRRVIGWALDETLEDKPTIAALEMAQERRQLGPGLVHHSDRGVQYASKDYIDRLKARGIQISMSRRGNPYDCGVWGALVFLANFTTLFAQGNKFPRTLRSLQSHLLLSVSRDNDLPKTSESFSSWKERRGTVHAPAGRKRGQHRANGQYLYSGCLQSVCSRTGRQFFSESRRFIPTLRFRRFARCPLGKDLRVLAIALLYSLSK